MSSHLICQSLPVQAYEAASTWWKWNDKKGETLDEDEETEEVREGAHDETEATVHTAAVKIVFV